MTHSAHLVPQAAPLRPRLVELAVLFLRLGVTAFGGPAAHIAMMEEEVVRRRAWLSSEEFLDLLGATNLIPGPNSTELAIHIGHKRAGWAGLLVAGACFIVPAALITLVLAVVYVRFGKVPRAMGVLYGIKPVVIAVVVQALWNLGRSAMKTKRLAALGIAGVVAAAAGVSELVVLFGGGLIAIALSTPSFEKAASVDEKPTTKKSSVVGLTIASTGAAGASTVVAASSWSLFLVFAKIGSILFGSGYVLLAFLRADLVESRHWMTESQLVDAVAVGQLTPGPVFTTATFVGFVIHGYSGAAAATLGIFLPAFVFVALSGLLIPKVRASKRAGAFLDGVNVTSLALMAVVTVQLGRAALVDALTVVLAASSVLLLKWKVSSVWLIVGGAIAGVVVTSAVSSLP
jgi:chromate transporter